ncbi:MAG: YgdI/YgdR family lipoprotein [Opitutaceae bacterium]|nr:YgdI/YgdR family lipoprotein [Verrucomicrobiales bacterium]
MKPILTLSLAAMFLTGCQSSYKITLNTGATLVSPSKPQLMGGLYVYKDSSGVEREISSSRVKTIERQ